MNESDPNTPAEEIAGMSKRFQRIQGHISAAWESKGSRGVLLAAWEHSGIVKGLFISFWTRFWMLFAGMSFSGRIATRLATWFALPYYRRSDLARLYPKGYIAPTATIHHPGLELGANICINDRVIIFHDKDGGPVKLAARVFIHSDTIIQTGLGGSLTVGYNTHIHPRCMLSAYKSSIQIGCRALIAPNCAFYSYDHGILPGQIIRTQPLQTKGGIVIDDDTWLGYGVIVLDGVRIGKGAVIGAGAVVTHDVPDGAIAVGNPARVVKMRTDVTPKVSGSLETNS